MLYRESLVMFVLISFLVLVTAVMGIVYLAQGIQTQPSEKNTASAIYLEEDSYTQEFYRGDNQGAFHPSPGLGNVIAFVLYFYLEHRRDGKPFSYDAKGLKGLQNKKWSDLEGLEEIFPKMKTKAIFKSKSPMPYITRTHQAYINNPHDVSYYLPCRKELLNFVGTPESITLWDKYDVMVHVRLDDVSAGFWFMSVLPKSYYRNVFKSITRPKARVLIVCKPPHSDLLVAALEVAKEGIKEGGGGTTIDIQSENVAKDFTTLMRTKTIVLSASTFSFWVAFLSPCITEVHLPHFGIMGDEVRCGSIQSSKWKSTPEQKIILHKLRDGFTTIKDKNRLYTD